MKRNILIIGNYPPPHGGVPGHLQYLAPYLAKKGWNVHIFSLARNRRFVSARQNANNCWIYRPSHLRRKTALFDPLISVPCAYKFETFARDFPDSFAEYVARAKLIKRIVRNHDISLISAYHIPAGLFGGWVAEEFSIPLVTHVFGEIYARPELYRRQINEVRYVCALSKLLTSCSDHCARSFQALGLNPSVATIYYGIDTKVFSPDRDGSVIRQQLNIKNDDKVILYVGRFVEELGLHVLLDALPVILERRPHTKIILAGARGSLHQRACATKDLYRESVFVMTDVPCETLPLLYAAATMTVAPSINARACLGLAIGEAMATGKPVVASDVGGTPEIAIHGETAVLVPPNDPAALAEAVLDLIDNDELIERMGQRGRKWIEERFDKDTTNQKLEKIFSEMVGSQRVLVPS
jgi:glycosyltransferase involved in cell wall biosynthesis